MPRLDKPSFIPFCLILITTALAIQSASAIEPGSSQVIDSFDYADTSSAQEVWKAVHQGGPEIEVKSIEGKSLVSFPTPFASDAEKPRFSIDHDVTLDLSRMTSLTLEVRGMGEEVSAQVSVYLRSGKGWYSGAGYVTKPGWRKIVISRDRYGSEGTPAGWDKIDGVRISVWPHKKEPRDTSFNLKSLKARWNNTAIILPNADDKEYQSTESIAKRMEAILRETGIGVDLLSEDALLAGALGDRPLAILPHNARLAKESSAALESYVSNGGKLFLSYSLPAGIADVLGFKKGTYYGEKNPGDFAAIQFDAKDVPGLPDRVKQNSWNIITAEPVAHNARIIGHWLDAGGNSTEKAAMLLSDRGAFLSHIMLTDDPEGKTAMLTAILGKLNPGLWEEAARNAQFDSEKTGHCNTVQELAKFVGNGKGGQKFIESKTAMAHSSKLAKEGNAFDSYSVALHARKLRAQAYLMSHSSREVEARAFWNHSGTGAYPGDWERTTREMAAGGLNMILPNMLWGGLAHYPSDVLPRSKTFEKYGDQIEQCVVAGKKNGIEVHVWKVNFNLGHGVPQEYIDRLRGEGRLQVSVDGEPGDWLNPAHPENFQMELDSILEVVRNYDIDGFHFDYIRYPGSKNDFSDYSRKKFESDTGNKVKNWPADCYDGPLLEAYTDWRCGNITRLVKAVSEQARKIRPGIRISAAVFRDYPNCRKWVAQDWPLWAKEGYVDFLCPMDYTDDDEKYIDWITTQKSLLPEGFPLYPGIGVSLRNKTQSADRVVGQIHSNREVGTGGYTIFNLNESTLQSVTTGLSQGAGETKAIPPHRVTK